MNNKDTPITSRGLEVTCLEPGTKARPFLGQGQILYTFFTYLPIALQIKSKQGFIIILICGSLSIHTILPLHL